MYTFYLGHADHAWTIKLRYSDCAAVFAACAKVDVPLPTPPPKTWRLTSRGAAEAAELAAEVGALLGRKHKRHAMAGYPVRP